MFKAAIFADSDMTYVMDRESDAVASFLSAHQPYATMPIMHDHTRMGPFLIARKCAVARAAIANPTYRDHASRDTGMALLEDSSALSGLLMGLALMAGRKEAMKGRRMEEVRDDLFPLRPFGIKAAYFLNFEQYLLWYMHGDA